MIRLLIVLLLLVSATAWAADGAEVSVMVPTGKSSKGHPRCWEICKDRTTATDCGPFYVDVPNPSHITVKVVEAENAGSSCTYDDWGIYASRDNTTPDATNIQGALCALDDDGTTSVVSASGSGECDIFGPVLPWFFINAGTLGTCSDFTVEICAWE